MASSVFPLHSLRFRDIKFGRIVLSRSAARGSLLLAVAVLVYPSALTSALVVLETGSTTLGQRLLLSLVFNAAFYAVFTAMAAFLPPVVGRILMVTLYSFLAVFTLLNVIHFHLYSQLLGLPSVYAALDTTGPEASEFARSALMNLGPLRVLLALVAAAPLGFGVLRVSSLPSGNGPPVVRCGLALAGAAALFALWQFAFTRPYLQHNNPVIMMSSTILEAVRESREIKRLLESSAGDMPTGVVVADGEPVTHILVIGESTTSRHMSLYGYPRDTTPELKKLASELDIATDACSSRSTTTEQLKELLTFATRENPKPLTTAPTLIQLMKAGGFKTYWLTNQQLAGQYDRWAGIFSKPADERHLINMRGTEEGISYDENLLPHLKQVLADPSSSRKFVVVHLLGTHQSYDLRYPPRFGRFNDLAGIDGRFLSKGHSAWNTWLYNTYDNAVLYNDFIVSQIIGEAKKVDRATVTFLSDHGESLGEEVQWFGHYPESGPRQLYEIPLMFFSSPSFQGDLGEKLAQLRNNLNQPVQSDQLMHTFLDLYGIEHPLFQAGHSLLRANFQPAQRYCDTFELPQSLPSDQSADARSAMTSRGPGWPNGPPAAP